MLFEQSNYFPGALDHIGNDRDKPDPAPTWALPYMANGDATGLKDKEIKMIDNLLRNRCIELVCPIADSVQGGMPPYYTKDPLFGKATEVEDCIVFYNI